MMSQTLNGQQPGSQTDLVTRGGLVDLGNFASVLHRHDTRRKLGLEFHLDRNHDGGVGSRMGRNFGLNPSRISLEFRAVRVSSKHVLPALHSVGLGLVDQSGEEIAFTLQGPAEDRGDRDLFSHRQDDRLVEEEEEEEDAGPANELMGVAGRERENLFRISAKSDTAKLADCIRKYEQTRGSNQFSNMRRATLESPGHADIETLLETVRFRRDILRHRTSEFLPSAPVSEAERRIDRFQPGVMGLVDILRAFNTNLQGTLGGLSYLGPLRTHPARHYVIDGVPGSSVGSRGEQAVQILFRDREQHGDRSPLLRRLNETCARFEIPYTFDLKNVGDAIAGDVIVLSLTDLRTDVRVGPADVGFGIGQLLPILIEGILVRERNLSARLVCVEQPEIHLHPRLQAAMADFFIETALPPASVSTPQSSQSRGHVQWVLETHSEALILRLQRRIREGKVSNRDVSVLYVDPRDERGSSINELRLDEDGEFLDLWPDGFFVEGFGELMGGR